MLLLFLLKAGSLLFITVSFTHAVWRGAAVSVEADEVTLAGSGAPGRLASMAAG